MGGAAADTTRTDVLKLLVKLAFVALLANAAYHIGAQYLTYIKFQDAVRDAAIFKARNDEELMSRIVSLAQQYEIPLDEENVTIDRQGTRVVVNGWYDAPVEVAPSYEYPWHFGLAIDVTTQTTPTQAAPTFR